MKRFTSEILCIGRSSFFNNDIVTAFNDTRCRKIAGDHRIPEPKTPETILKPSRLTRVIFPVLIERPPNEEVAITAKLLFIRYVHRRKYSLKCFNCPFKTFSLSFKIPEHACSQGSLAV